MKNVVTYREADGSIIKFESHSHLSSTLELAKEYAKDGDYPDRYVVFTDKRTKLKTSERDFEVESESGIYMSCIFRPSFFPSQASLLSAMAAAATVSGLEEHTDKKLGIGWVSDIYCEGTRIGGVSIEGKLDNYKTYEYIIVTFTCSITPDNFPLKLADMIKKVFDTDNSSINMILARDILSKFLRFYENLKNSSKFMSIYTDRFALRGKKVKYLVGEKWKTKRVIGVDPQNGALILDNGKRGEIRVTSPALITVPKKL